jgi:amino acid adenylation domain-containing protein/FkbM family methyltransferase
MSTAVRDLSLLTTVQFLSYLQSADIELWPEGERLRFSAPPGGLGPDLRAELARRKAEVLEFLRQSARVEELPPITPVDRTGPLPTSFAQERLWFLDQYEPWSPAYTISPAFRLAGKVEVDLLARCLAEIVRRHEVLRTTFAADLGRPVQVIAPPKALPILVIDLAGLPRERGEEQARQLSQAMAAEPFDLRQGPLLRVSLVTLAAAESLFLITFHHIVYDGWSSAVLIRELLALYAAFAAGLPSPLPALAIQYVDYAAWQRQRLTGEVLAAELDYWRRQLAAAPRVLDLPTDRPRPLRQGLRGSSLKVALDRHLSAVLSAFGREEEATPYMVLLAAFQTLLGRYTGQWDLVTGSVVAGRTRREIEELIGFFVNTLVLRSDLSGDVSFRQLLGRVRETAVAAFAHQEVPFERLVEELQPERHLNRNPLFQVMFVLQNAPAVAIELPGLKLVPLERRSETAKFDLILSLHESAEGLGGSLEYATDLYDRSTAARFLGHFEALLQGIAEDPDRALPDLPWLTGGERHQLSVEWLPVEWNAGLTLPPSACLHEAFAVQARRRPGAVAVVCEGESLSYGDLDQSANRLAHRLRSLGVGPEVLVGLSVERSLDMVIAILGILKAGGAYVPLDPAYPTERLAAVLEEVRPAVLVTQERLRDRLPRLPAEAARILCLDAASEGLEGERSGPPGGFADPSQLAYVIYTSGSTGRPKGSPISHANVARLFTATAGWFGFDERDVWTLFHSYAFDFSVWELWGALLHGGRLVVVPHAVSRSPEAFNELLREEGVTVLNQTPSAFRQLIQVEEAGAPTAGVELRWVIFGGEALDLTSLAPWFARHGDLRPRLVNMYGITETTVHVSFRPLAAADLERSYSSPIGIPIPDLTVRILDARGRPVPVGVPGEMFVGGAGPGRGYLAHPDLTAERFVPDPGGARLYRTGDRARYLPGGEIEYLGRVDDQVKIRGFRIEPGEIEAVLAGHPGVSGSAVFVRDYGVDDRRLVAALVPDGISAAPVLELLRLEREGALAGHSLRDLPNGLSIVHLNPNETDFVYEEVFLGGAYLQHGIELRPGAVVFDVGANIGLFTLFVSQRVPGARIFAFEPIPAVFEVLRLNAEIHGADVQVFDCGLAAEEGIDEFTYYPNASVLSGRFADEGEEQQVVRSFLLGAGGGQGLSRDEVDELLRLRLAGQRVRCRLRTVSDVLRENGVQRIDLLKIDVEKSELEVLQGIAEEDWPKIEQIALEVHDSGGRLDLVTAMLASRGYELAVDQDSQLGGTCLYNVYAIRGQGRTVAAEESMLPAEPRGPRWASPDRLLADVRGHLKRKLPEHMVPAHFVLLDALPLTPSGKLDRRALQALQETRPHRPQAARETALDLPQDPTEELLARIWEEVLHRDRVGRDDSFFDLGGHSLLATQVVSRVRQTFEIELPLHRLFEAPTLAGLAQKVREARRARAGLELPPILPVPRDGDLPLSFAQRRLWVLHLFEPGSTAYNMPTAVRLRGPLAHPVLERALGEVVRRHEILRTTYTSRAGRPLQVVAPEPPESRLRLPRVDLRGMARAARETEASRLAAEEARRPFDLEVGPMIRTTLLVLEERECWVLLTLHHIAFDGWSVGVLLTELAVLYAALSLGKTPDLPELTVQYVDFACWQERWLDGDALETDLAYWRRQLAGAPQGLPLVPDRPRPAIQTSRGASVEIELPAALSAALAAASRERGATLFMAILAGFAALLGRSSGQSDIVLGSPIAGRNRREIESLIGFFVNTLVLRLDLAAGPSFEDLLARARQVALDAYAHQDLPFERLVEDLSPERDLGRSPLFQVMLALQNAPVGTLEMPGLVLEPLPLPSGAAMFDLTLSLSETPRGISGSLEYNRDLFDPTTLERLAGRLETLLAAAVRDPAARMSDLPLLQESERHQVLLEWNATATESRDICLHERVEARVAAAPEAVAVVSAGAVLTYGELGRRARRLAGRLRAAGVGPEVLVGLCAERSLEMVVGMLAVLTAGGAYLPLDPDYPPDRLAFLLADAKPPVALVAEHLLDRLPEVPGVHRLPLGAAVRESGGEMRHLPPLAIADNAAYGIYTSGSTGKPKGVINSHRGIVNRLLWIESVYPLSPADRVLQKTPFSFDVSVWEFFWPLVTGATLVMAVPGGHRDSAYLVRTIAEEEITHTHFVPSLLQPFLEEPGLDRCTALRRVLCSGEALLPEVARRFFLRFPADIALLNLYGPTEAAVEVTFWRCQPEDAGRAVPIGRPIANTEIHILDREGLPAPLGVPGELHIGGIGVARGYLDRPGLTAEKFVPDPFARRPGARLYRTGDLARTLSGGEIEYLGRIDQQVKIRGFRIELGEIEAVLAEHRGVREVAVVVQKHLAEALHLIAFFAAADGVEVPSAAELRDWLGVSLPVYMVPSALVRLDELPLTLSGKVDRSALARMEIRWDRENAFVAPRNRMELALQQIWEEVLRVSPIGVTENFFKIGGNSLLAIYIIVCIRERLGRELPVPVLVQEPTIEGLAKVLQQGPSPQVLPSLVPLQPKGGKPPLFVIHGAGGNVFYFVELARLLANLDPERPFYGLQARGLMSGEEPLETIEEMASTYLEAIRGVEPAGPYLLAGYSMGGLVAYEVARRLVAEGQEIAFVGMFDAMAHLRTRLESMDRAEVIAYFAGELTIPITGEELRDLDPDGQLQYVLTRGWELRKIPRELTFADAQRYFRVMETTFEAARRFEPGAPLPGRVTVFGSAGMTQSEGRELGWRAEQGVDAHQVPGDHRTLFESPNVEVLGELLGDCLGRCEAERSEARIPGIAGEGV